MFAASQTETQMDLGLLREVMDQLPAYVAYVDRDLRYLMANYMYVERFGRSEGDIVGRLVAEVTGPAFQNVKPSLERALSGETMRFETMMISVDGDRQLSVQHRPHRGRNGDVVGVIVYGVDITDQRRAEAALIQTEKLAAVGRLASSIAHEINNPLESVVNLLYLIEQTVGADANQAQQFAQLAQHELARVSQISTQTLRFFRQSTARSEADMAELMDSVLTLYAGRLLNSHISIERRYQPETRVLCFESEVRQVLNNLVGNAIDAMRKGGRLQVRVRRATEASTGEPGVRITVADDGCGMSVETLGQIFEPFFTTKGISGTGLGLWISQDLVAKHHGRLSVHSREAGGTVFTLFLPAA